MIATRPIIIPLEIEGGRYTPAFLSAIKGASAWSREARILLAFAAARGVQLDEAALILADVRDLRAMRDALLTASAH